MHSLIMYLSLTPPAGEPTDDELNHIMANTIWSRTLKKICLTGNVIGRIVTNVRSTILVDHDGVPTQWKNGKGGLYNRLILQIANLAAKKGATFPDCLPCFDCRNMIFKGNICICMNRQSGRKYFHPICAWRKNII